MYIYIYIYMYIYIYIYINTQIVTPTSASPQFIYFKGYFFSRLGSPTNFRLSDVQDNT